MKINDAVLQGTKAKPRLAQSKSPGRQLVSAVRVGFRVVTRLSGFTH